MNSECKVVLSRIRGSQEGVASVGGGLCWTVPVPVAWSLDKQL